MNIEIKGKSIPDVIKIEDLDPGTVIEFEDGLIGLVIRATLDGGEARRGDKKVTILSDGQSNFNPDWFVDAYGILNDRVKKVLGKLTGITVEAL